MQAFLNPIEAAAVALHQGLPKRADHPHGLIKHLQTFVSPGSHGPNPSSRDAFMNTCQGRAGLRISSVAG